MPVFVNGRAGGQVDPGDRGLQFGDGLFETMAIRDGRARFVEWHLERLAEGTRRLALPLPDPEGLRALVVRAWPTGHGVVKLILTRGTGGRGYRPVAGMEPTCIVAGFDWPAWPASAWTEGVCLRWCRTRLSRNPALAGIKHLNRLEQVLARAEWEDESIAEGLMQDDLGQVISGTQSNVFAVIDGQIVTPPVDECGVSGVMRRALIAWAMEHASPIRERAMRAEDLMHASELLVTNALIGAWPVRELAGRRVPTGGVAPRFNAWLAGI
jgi:4-amino-4-deoxychorismate lyase